MINVVKLVNGELEENAYMVINTEKNEAVVIDGGVNARHILIAEKEYGVKIKAMLLTHAHFDHAGCTAELKKRGVKIYVHEQDEHVLGDKYNLGKYFGYQIEPTTADQTFTDGDKITEADMVFEVMQTSGHSMGSSCFILGDVMFTGDTLFRGSCGRSDFLDGSEEDMRKSLKKLFALEKNYTLYTGHGENSTLDYEKKFNIYNV